MKQNRYGLFFVGALLLWTACSDKSSPLSGSTEIPNMGQNYTEPVICGRVSAGDSAGIGETDCYWSAEMWNRESGYRVHTGFDNGTNTSGIWYWTDDAGNAVFDWPDSVTSDYDSMALAKVIDKCGGSVCGNLDFESDYSRASLKFSFAGKDSSGKFESIDAHSMQGICVEYFGESIWMELDYDDSLSKEFNGTRFDLLLPEYKQTEKQAGQKGKEICLPWNAFKPNIYRYGVNLDDVVSHLRGISFVMAYPGSNRSYFEIVSLGRFSGDLPEDLHPVEKECKAVYVKEYFCECSYTDERSEFDGKVKAASYSHKFGYSKLSETSVFRPKAVTVCLGDLISRADATIMDSRSTAWDRPCEEPLPKTIVCKDGSVSESKEFAKMYKEYEKMVNKAYDKEKDIVDSEYAYCLASHDTLSDGRAIPDTCRVESMLEDRDVDQLDYADGAYEAAWKDFVAWMDSLYSLDSSDEATRYCLIRNMSDTSLHRIVSYNTDPGNCSLAVKERHPIVKSIECKSGKTYDSDEYKEFLKELGLKNDKDSLKVYAAAKKVYSRQIEEAFNTCVDKYGDNRFLWEGVWTKVNTGFDNGSGTSGKWYYETDSADGGDSHIEWNHGYVVDDWDDAGVFDSLLLVDHRLKGTLVFEKKKMKRNPYVNLGFWLAGEDGKGGHDVVDVSEKQGICVVFDSVPQNTYIQLDMGDSLNTLVDGDLFTAKNLRNYAVESDSGMVGLSVDVKRGRDCFSWDDFEQSGSGKTMKLKNALKHVAGIKIHFESPYKDDLRKDSFVIRSIYYK
jgi:hypothetical protein